MREDRHNKDLEEFSISDEAVEVQDRVSGEKGGGFKKKIVYVLLVIVGFFFAYRFFAGEAGNKGDTPPPRESQVEERVLSPKEIKKGDKENFVLPKEDVTPILLPPKLPELPKLPPIPIPLQPEAPAANPLNPPRPTPGPALPSFFPSGPLPPGGSSPMEAPSRVGGGGRYKYNRSAPMIAFGGSGGPSEGQSSGFSMSDPTSLLDPDKLGNLRKSLQQTDTTPLEDKALTRSASQIVAGYVGDLNYVLAEGKMLDAVLETAVNTGLKAKIRAVVSRDVFSESGNQILIPKGSRLIGSYSTDISLTQSRVDIIWSRIILPNGIDVNLGNFSGVDPLGRAGVGGIVHSKVSNVMTTSILLATARVASGMIVDKIMGTNDKSQMSFPRRRSTVNKDDNDDDSKIKGSPGAIIAMQAVQDASKQVTDYVRRVSDTNPTITVNQGTKLKVFVNQDIVFPRVAFQEYKVLN